MNPGSTNASREIAETDPRVKLPTATLIWLTGGFVLAVAGAAAAIILHFNDEIVFDTVSRYFSPDQHLSATGKRYTEKFLYYCAGWSIFLSALSFRLCRSGFRTSMHQRLTTDRVKDKQITRPLKILAVSGLTSLAIMFSGILTLISSPHIPALFAEEGLLFMEDGIFENLTVAIFLFACVVLVNAARKVRWMEGVYGQRRIKIVVFLYLGLGLLSFGIAMEEVSWGQRLLDFKTPELLYNYNRQGEFNIHNLFNPHRDMINTTLATIVMLVLLLGWFRTSSRNEFFFELIFPHASLLVCAILFAMAGAMETLLTNEIFEVLIASFILFYSYRIWCLSARLFDPASFNRA